MISIALDIVQVARYIGLGRDPEKLGTTRSPLAELLHLLLIVIKVIAAETTVG
jgi:hypothetical protein